MDVKERTPREEARRSRMQDRKRRKKRLALNVNGSNKLPKKVKKRRRQPPTEDELKKFESDDSGSLADSEEETQVEKVKPKVKKMKKKEIVSERIWLESRQQRRAEALSQGLDPELFASDNEVEDDRKAVEDDGDDRVSSGKKASKSGESDDEDVREGGDAAANGEGAFARAFARIMEEKVAEDTVVPILAKKTKALIRKQVEEADARLARKEAFRKKKELKEKCHVLPKAHTDAKEKSLIKTATKGVVQLFNAVSKAQKAQTLPLTDRKGMTTKEAAKEVEKRNRQAFLAELRGVAAGGTASEAGVAATAALPTNEAPPSQGMGGDGKGGTGWDVLREDYMLGRSKLKDWDKEKADDDEASGDGMDGSDNDSDL